MELRLPPVLPSVTAARRWVTDRAKVLGMPDAHVWLVELLSSELVANAIAHVPGGGPISVAVRDGENALVVAVRDTSREPPLVRRNPPGVPGGKGLQLVEMLADDWGFEIDDDGKTVWFRVTVPES
jgi:anti-sigma regulatory factor (Ser/Thr protein kinase)